MIRIHVLWLLIYLYLQYFIPKVLLILSNVN